MWGRTGFDVMLEVLGACRALAKCSLNNWSQTISATDSVGSLAFA